MDVELFKKTFIPCHQKMYRIAYRIVRDESMVEDILQETFIKLWNSRDKIDGIDNKEAYAIIILKNTSLDFLRKDRADKYAQEYDLQISTRESLPVEIEVRDQLTLVRHLINKLPEQQKLVFELRHLEEYEMDEISQSTGLSLVNVRVILSRARKTIREQFKKIENTDVSK